MAPCHFLTIQEQDLKVERNKKEIRRTKMLRNQMSSQLLAKIQMRQTLTF